MKIINRTNNTVEIQEIGRTLPYLENGIHEISEDELLRSRGLQVLIAAGKFEIVEAGESRIERNTQRMQTNMAKLRSATEKISSLDTGKADASDRGNKAEVVVKGHFLEAGGYAKYNRNLALGLKALGYDVKVDVIGSKNQLTEKEASAISGMKGRPSKHAIRIDSLVPSFGNTSAGRNSVLYTTVESYTVPKQFITVANSYQEVWVTSDFCKQVLETEGVKRPIYVMPCSVDKNLYVDEGDKYDFKPSLRSFVFVSVFGWSYRKGYDVLLKSYLEEFSDEDDVSLLLVTRYQNEPKRSDKIRKEVQEFIQSYGGPRPAHIARCHRIIPENQMPSLYRACNAFVLFSRGEGFGLPYCEASLCGLPVIGTDCSAQSMFLNNQNSYLLDIDYKSKVPSGKMHVHYWDEQEFPQFTSNKSSQTARQLMREVYDNYDEALIKNNKLKNKVEKDYAISNVVLKIKSRIDEIWSRK